jgi:hypothetical protein
MEDISLCTEWYQAFLDFSLLVISSWIEFLSVGIVPKYLKCSTISDVLLPILMLWFYAAVWSRDMTIYLALTAFISGPIFLLAINKAFD